MSNTEMNNNSNKKQSFLKKYPVLQCFMALCFIVILGKGLWCGGSIFFNWLFSLNDVQGVIVVGIISGTISIICTIVAKWLDYKTKRRVYLNQKREKPYEEFVSMFYKLQRHSKGEKVYSEKEMINDILSFSEKLTLWGSKNVVKKWVTFRLSSLNPDDAVKNMFLIEEIINEMRDDFSTGRTNKGTILSFIVNDVSNFIKK